MLILCKCTVSAGTLKTEWNGDYIEQWYTFLKSICNKQCKFNSPW